MAKLYKDLRAKIPADARKRAETRADVLMQEMPLYELRQARQLSQVQLARELHASCTSGRRMYRKSNAVRTSIFRPCVHTSKQWAESLKSLRDFRKAR